MNELIEKVIEWGEGKGLIPGESDKQYLKFMEELGETGKAILKNDPDGIKDGIGDTLVTAIIFFKQNGLNIEESYFDNTGKIPELRWIFANMPQYMNDYYIESVCWLITCIARKYNLTVYDCLEAAYNEIKDRKGKTIDGTFIKQSDLV